MRTNYICTVQKSIIARKERETGEAFRRTVSAHTVKDARRIFEGLPEFPKIPETAEFRICDEDSDHLYGAYIKYECAGNPLRTVWGLAIEKAN